MLKLRLEGVGIMLGGEKKMKRTFLEETATYVRTQMWGTIWHTLPEQSRGVGTRAGKEIKELTRSWNASCAAVRSSKYPESSEDFKMHILERAFRKQWGGQIRKEWVWKQGEKPQVNKRWHSFIPGPRAQDWQSEIPESRSACHLWALYPRQVTEHPKPQLFFRVIGYSSFP